jgi:hypothetical protein
LLCVVSALRREREVRPRVVADRAEVERRNWRAGVLRAVKEIVLAERRITGWNADAMTLISLGGGL